MSAPFPADLGSAHVERQADLERAKRLERAKQRVAASIVPTGPAAAAPGAPAAPQPQQPGASAPPASQPPAAGASGTEQGLRTAALGELPDTGGGITGQQVGAVAKDVGRGALEALPQAGAGALEGLIRQPAAAVKDLADWLSSISGDKLPGLRINFTDPNYPKGLSLASGKEIRDLPGTLETLLGKPVEALEAVPGFGEPASTTGGLVRGIAQFAAPFLASGGIGSLARLEELGKVGALASGAARGALVDFAAFDPAQRRLSNLVQDFPALANPVTEYLQSSPDDGAAEGRFKQAVEGLGVGAATQGLVAGVKALRAMSAVKAAAGVTDEAASGALRVAEAERVETVAKLGGDPSAPALQIVPPAPVAGQLAAAGADVPGEVFVNWSRINAHDDVKAMIQELVDARAGNIDTARRGVRTWEATKLEASQMDAWKVLQERRVGQPLGAAESFAVRELWVRSGRRVAELARAAAANKGELDLLALRKQLLVHNAIQEQVIPARTETARALNAWAIPAGDTPAFAGQMEQLRALAQHQGGDKALLQVAQRLTAAADAGLAREADAFIEATGLALTKDAVRQAWYAALLSNPKTLVRNMIGNAANLFLEIPEAKVAAYIGKLRGNQAVPDEEAMQRLFGLVQGYTDAWSISRKQRQVFETALDMHVAGNPEGARELLAQSADEFFSSGAAEAQGGVRQFPQGTEGAFDPAKWGLGPDTVLGRFMGFMDTATTASSKALQRTDEIAKSMAFNAQLRAEAYRQATAEVAAGRITKGEMADRLAELLASPTDAMRLASRAAAEVRTFTNEPMDTAMWRFVKAWHNVPVFGDITMPFARTPYNIATQVMQRTPAAPFMKSWRADILAGGAKGDLAWSRFIVGNVVLMTTANFALAGLLTGEGPSDPQERATLMRTGWKPWSAKAGDRYFDYRTLEPIGPLIGLAANTVDILRAKDFGQADEDGKLERLVIATSMAIAAQATDQSFMSGASSFFDAMQDPQRYGERWWQQLATSATIPRGVAAIERITDPNQRYAWDIGAAIRSQTPGLSADLPPARDLWGRPIKSGSGFGPWYDLLSPSGSSKLEAQPIDTELIRLEKWIGNPGKDLTIDGVKVPLSGRPAIYSRYVELAGNAWAPDGGMGAMDTLNAIVTGKHDLSEIYREQTDGPDGTKAQMIEDIVDDWREGAKQQLLAEFPELEAEVRRKQEEMQQR